MTIARVALPVGANQLFEYWVPAGLALDVGRIVKVPLGARMLYGVVTEIGAASTLPDAQIQSVSEVVEHLPPLEEDLLAIGRFIATYYQHPLGQCYAMMLPPVVTLSRRSASAPLPQDRRAGAVTIALNDAQAHALDDALPRAPAFQPSLLHGITGSGKTEVYLAAVAKTVAAGGQALLLVPEINLTPQLEERIARALPRLRVAVMHSRMSSGERLRNWLSCARGDADLIVATRLGVFAPAARLGLIVVDEEHDPSFKQQDGVRYHARDVAIYRARMRGVPIVLGSATPSLESFWHAKSGRYRMLSLKQRATTQATLPRVLLAPNRDPAAIEGMGATLQAGIAARLARKEQTLVFVNRRGFAPSLLCASCAWKAMCSRCDARMVLHRADRHLRCHHCGLVSAIPSACPECGNQDLLPVGFGTQRLEQALLSLFPAARIARIDRDSTRRKGAFAGMRDDVASGAVDILVGTQMLAKGHDFPRVTLVGVLGADNALYSAEFRASERLFALLEQVAGRAGRGDVEGEVIVQTDFPRHPLFSALVQHDYERFAESLLSERKEAGLPPFAHLALLSAEAKTVEPVLAFLESAAETGKGLAKTQGGHCVVHAPVPASLARRAGMERAQVLVQSVRRKPLQDLISSWRPHLEATGGRVRWALDVDPLDFA